MYLSAKLRQLSASDPGWTFDCVVDRNSLDDSTSKIERRWRHDQPQQSRMRPQSMRKNSNYLTKTTARASPRWAWGLAKRT